MAKRVLLTGWLLLFLFIKGEAQQANPLADSLMKEAARHTQDDSNRVTLMLNIANTILYDSPEVAMSWTNRAGALAEKLNWTQGIALSYRQKGLNYYVQNDYVPAMDYYQRALKAGEPLHSKKFDATLYNNIGNIYADIGQHQKALETYGRYLETAKELNLADHQMNAHANMGTVYTELNDYPAALSQFEDALRFADQAGGDRTRSFILSNIGSLYERMGDYDKAWTNLQECIRLAGQAGYATIKSPALNVMARIQLQKGQYAEAGKNARESLRLAEASNSTEWKSDALKTLSQVLEKQGNFAAALGDFRLHAALRDSMLNQEKKRDLLRRGIESEFEKKEADIRAEHERQQALAEAELHRQRTIRNASIGVALVILIAGLLSLFFYKRKRDEEAKRKEAEFKALVADTEMKLLRLQMNPHFIFNSLNSISDYIVKNDLQKADQYLGKFSRLMRMTLENSEQKAIPLATDLQALEWYMQLEAARLNHKFEYEIKIDESIDPAVTLVPPMILQPFIENSIWHGLAGKPGKGKISIHISREADMLSCIVEDDGVGRQAETAGKKERPSMGIRITRARIEILNRIRRSRAGLEISDLRPGVRVSLKLPYDLSF